jgi:hypothetical protein
MARPPAPPLALAKIDLEEKSLEVRLRLKGKAAVDLADYQRAYQAANGQAVEAEPLVLHILAAFIDADRGFQAWRKVAGPPHSNILTPRAGARLDAAKGRARIGARFRFVRRPCARFRKSRGRLLAHVA